MGLTRPTPREPLYLVSKISFRARLMTVLSVLVKVALTIFWIAGPAVAGVAKPKTAAAT